jgi:hypothetical protein
MNSVPVQSSSEMTVTSSTRVSRKQSNPSSEWTGKWANVQSRLYLVIHEITSALFHSPEAQECLSILASCDSITMIASSSLLNGNLLWDSLFQSRYCWRYLKLNTFQHYKIPFDHPLFRNVVSGPGGLLMRETTGQSLLTVLTSLGHKHIEFLNKIGACYLKSKNNSENNGVSPYYQNGYIIIPSQEVVVWCTQDMIVQKNADLQVLLKELIDHRILVTQYHETKGQVLKFLISEDDFQIIKQSFN